MKFIRLNTVMDMTGLARATIYKYMKANAFPKTVSLGGKSVAWVESEVLHWIELRIAQRDAAE